MVNKADAWIQERLDRSPVRELRIARYPNRSTLCKQLGISDSVVYLSELHCYPQLPPRLENMLLPLPERKDFEKVYREFQKEERAKFGFIFGINEVTRLSFALGGSSPLYMLTTVLGVSRADLGKGLCVQPSLLYRLDRGRALSLPEDFAIALRQAGMSSDTVRFLDEKQQAYAR